MCVVYDIEVPRHTRPTREFYVTIPLLSIMYATVYLFETMYTARRCVRRCHV